MKFEPRWLAYIAITAVLFVAWTAFNARAQQATTAKLSALSTSESIAAPGSAKVSKVSKSEDEWRRLLSPEAFSVLRQAGTERPFSADLQSHGAGIFQCAGCNLDLFDASTKFDSGTGWPSFWKPIAGHVQTHTDNTFGMARVEVLCASCGGHLGHVFDDGPKPTGLRYCMNGVAMKFSAAK